MADATPSDDPDPALAPSLDHLMARLPHRFADPDLLTLALTHRSWCAEHPGAQSNERLEFLGDAVLGVAVTDELYQRFPGRAEGELAKMRATVVNAATLAELAEELDLGAGLRLGRGEHESGGRDKASILADAMEAVIGAVHLDAGVEDAIRFVLEIMGDRITTSAAAGPGAQDFKTRLQELVASEGLAPPQYEMSETGPDHEKRFHATVYINGRPRGRGRGSSKKQAEQDAAEKAWQDSVSESNTTKEDHA
ncbi:MAG: ribonuclease III [Acidimicrobiia bacterium]|nr:ribonuclease III [Acidimicrobiia bacterium]MDH5236324.1 ribonuclease III [Acidimicrobiia bacterium]